MKTLAVLAFLFSSLSLFAQKDPFKFGKVTEEDINIDSCDFYPEAHSMVLGEYGNLRFIFDDHNGIFKYQLEVIVRKKIFKKTDNDAGSFKIRYYEPVKGSSKEVITGLKGYTYNLENGKIKKTKLENSGKFDNRINDNMKEISVTMPEVQEGSVIEYTYLLTSEFLSTLKTWYFQSDIPVKYSELRVIIPEFYNYQVSNVGAVIPLEMEDIQRNEQFNSLKFGTFTSLSRYRRMIARNVLPIPDEPNMNNKVDVPNRLQFQLISIKMPQSPVKSIADTYESFNKQFIDRSDFGQKLSKGSFAKDYIEQLAGKEETERAASIYNWLKNHFSWNENWGLVSDKAGRLAYNEGSGSVSDINLSLVAAYRQAGLEAYPVILSTRGSGTPHPIYPSYNDFNYVVVIVRAGDTYYFSDATAKLPFGMLPTRCLNGQGWLISENGGSWVNLKQNSGYVSTTMVTTSITPEQIKNDVQLKGSGYAAISIAENINKNGEEKYVETISGVYPEWSLKDFSLEKTDPAEGISYTYSLTREREDEDILYLQPMLIGMETKNPYKREERFSPVDYPYSYHKRVVNIITFPEGYTAEVPESTIIALPDNAGRYLYNVTSVGQNVSITSELQLIKTDFSPNEYASLKQFYQIMAEKNSSLIVLKKL